MRELNILPLVVHFIVVFVHHHSIDGTILLGGSNIYWLRRIGRINRLRSSLHNS
jgi:hypothetical protein